ncbi:MAG TPA: gas vesicle protein [Myxococcales bacterium]|nr:gas vesicle protein [Myxococcales bacterium]
MPSEIQTTRGHSSGLVDVLDRVLDKGLVIAGDIKVSLAEVELLTIRVRLIVCSIDKAQQIGLDWWRYDQHLAPGRQQAELEKDQLRQQIRLLERKVESLTRRTPAARRRAASHSEKI